MDPKRASLVPPRRAFLFGGSADDVSISRVSIKKKGVTMAISQDRRRDGMLFERSLNVRCLFACRCPPDLRKLKTNLSLCQPDERLRRYLNEY